MTKNADMTDSLGDRMKRAEVEAMARDCEAALIKEREGGAI